jgi:polyisoprenyl-teichoic acid--peptidoglycan teichoic acid transferase
MEGFKDIVDAVGGVLVTNDQEFSQGGHQFAQGEILLNGEKALSYVRMRKQDPRGDFGRQQRQRQIIEGVIKKGANFSTLSKFDDIFGALEKNVKTNLTFDQMVDIQSDYKVAGKSIEQMQISGSGTMIGNIYYYSVPSEEHQRIQDELKQHLEL